MLQRYRPALLFVGYGLVLALVAAGVVLVVTRRAPARPVELAPAPTPLPVRVHVAGAVLAPGVYTLPAGSIVQDAIAAAGGTLAGADLSRLNLARRLQDGEQVLVPQQGQPAAVPPAGATTSGIAANPAAPININLASAADLEALPRIGPALAQRIVDYRAAHGPFARVEDLLLVDGIGAATLEEIRPLITVG